jgi:hypothetical protein
MNTITKNPLFYNPDGTLTKYALFCGYVETLRTNKYWVQMYIGHNHIHVRAGLNNGPFDTWETYEHNKLRTAAKKYNELLQCYKIVFPNAV